MKLIDKHNAKLAERGIPYTALSPYRSGSNPVNDYICTEGHRFVADRARIMSGKSKCPNCNPGQGRLLNHEGYEQRLLEVGADFFPTEKYAGASAKIWHECINGHKHHIEPRRVWEKINGCPYCSGMKKLTHEQYYERLSKINPYVIPLREYDGQMKKLKHQCKICDWKWEVKPHDLLNGTGCPACASFGLNRGRPATLYYVRLWDESKTYYKIGVTNNTPKHRLKNCGKQYKVLLEKQYETGREAEAAEQMILEEYKESKALAPKWLKTGGNTELFKHDILLLDDAK